MSAIHSLLRVMTLRDAEAIVLEAGKIPSLRRRGQLEALAMDALEAQLLADFAAPLLAARTVDDWPANVPLIVDGSHHAVTIERVTAGLRIVVRKGKPVPTAAPARPTSTAPTSPTAPAVSTASPSPSPATAPWRTPALPPTSDGSPNHVLSIVPPTAAHPHVLITELLGPALAIARDREASDVIVSTGRPVCLRRDGRLESLDLTVDDAELAACVAAWGNNADGSLEIDGTRVRCNAFEHLGGVGIAARLIRDRVPGLAELELPSELASVVQLRDGLVLVCGPTGSGKSTTLAALIDVLDQRRAAHVITLEDPIEYRFTPRRCLVHQREVGTHIPSFAAGLRAALREAPDVILLGELRDRETIAAALTAAETGHLVLATLHAPNAVGAIDRMIDAFPDTQQRQVRWQLASVLRTIVTQHLLPRRDGGRAVAVEVVPVTPAVANIMRKGDLHTLPTAVNTGRDAGMIPLERSLAGLLDRGVVTTAEVRKVAGDLDLLGALSNRLR